MAKCKHKYPRLYTIAKAALEKPFCQFSPKQNLADEIASLLLNRALRSAMNPVGLCPRRELESVPGTELVLCADLDGCEGQTSKLHEKHELPC